MDFTRKARWDKDGHRTPNPKTTNYSGVVSRQNICILFTHADVHRVSMKAADIQNSYPQDPTSEKHYIICGPEFGIENEGKQAVIVQDFYSGKSAGYYFWHHLRSCVDNLGFE